MIDTALIKSRMTCVAYARNEMRLPVSKPGDRCVSPLRAGADNRSAFVVNENFWFDFVDRTGGDVIDLCAMHRHKGDRGQAIYDLAFLTGVSADSEEYAQWRQVTQRRCNLIQTWHEDLRPQDVEYLHSRRITDQTIAELKIGYDHGRIIIPSFRNGYVYSWCGRAMNGQEPKYLKPANHETTEHFPWGMNTLDRQSDTLYVAEGCFDALSIYQEGLPVIATLGGHFGRNTLPAVLDICRGFKRVVLTFDNDEGGRSFTIAFGKILFGNRIPFSVAGIPAPYKDISDFYTAGGDVKDLDLQDGATHLALNITDKTAFRDFAFKAARLLDKPDMAELMGAVSRSETFSSDWLRAVREGVNKAPSEPVIVKEILDRHQLLYVDNVGFYEYFNPLGKWTLLSDTTIHGYVSDALGTFATGAKLTPIKNLMKPDVQTDNEFNRLPLINFKNGTLELETAVFREALPDDMCSVQLPYLYSTEAKCPAWRQFIEDVTDGDEKRMEILQFLAGYVLFNNCKHEKIFILTGNGGNGKSCFTTMLQRVFGFENCTNIKPKGLTEPFEVIHLKDSLLNVAGEIAADLANTEERLKEIATGELIQGCYKGKDFIRFNSRAKLVFCCNNPLSSTDTSDGLARRLVMVHFPCSFVERPDPGDPLQKPIDVDLLPKLEAEISGIFNWAYEGYRQLKSIGYFTQTDEHETMIQEFKEASNPVLLFARDLLEPDDRDEFDYSEVYDRYRSWCERTGHKPLANNKFHPKFKQATRGVLEFVQKSARIDGKPRRTRKYTKAVYNLHNYADGSSAGVDTLKQAVWADEIFEERIY